MESGGAGSATWRFIGTNGGLEAVAFDLRPGPPRPLAMIDRTAGEACARRIADDVCGFIRRTRVAAEKSGDSLM